MQIITIILLGLATALALPLESGNESSDDGWYVPQLDGSFEWMSEEDAQNFARENLPQSRAAAVVEYYLYTNDSPNTPKKVDLNDERSLRDAKFNKAYPTRFIIHGWQNNLSADVNVELRKALLESGHYNVFCVDWSDKAETINYPAAAMRVAGVGKQVAGFIDFLHRDGGMSFGSLIVIGHSLGAHVSGYAGKNVKYGRIHQITGLDPALPLFSFDKPADRLNSGDAEYVESIQTNGGKLGFLKPIGKGAFYPNGGKKQPGCGIDATGSCSHSRSFEYYAEAIRRNDFPSMKCGTYEEAVDKKCGSTYSSVRMGASSNYVNAFGDFYVPVNKKSPFGKSA